MRSFNTPILLLIFNRPDTTRIVFEEIKKLRPSKLYIAADGPRRDKIGEFGKCEETRSIVQQIDWNCDVHTLFRDNNLGCKMAVSSAITWFFDNEEEGIILEDDCKPDPTFFTFCEYYLNKYRNDTRIMHIGGTNFQDGNIKGQGSYYFSRLCHVWGWATWRRAWKYYDVEIAMIKNFIQDKVLYSIFPGFKKVKYWEKVFVETKSGRIDTWDYQWTYTCWTQNGLSVIPNVNLVSNIGFDENATHTTDSKNGNSNKITFKFDSFKDPLFVINDMEADKYTIKTHMIPQVGIIRQIFYSIKNYLKYG